MAKYLRGKISKAMYIEVEKYRKQDIKLANWQSIERKISKVKWANICNRTRLVSLDGRHLALSATADNDRRQSQLGANSEHRSWNLALNTSKLLS